jgi:aerobic carbon-monoxide dehydrogenase large subunit
VFASAISDAEGFAITAMPISPSELFDLRRQHAVVERSRDSVVERSRDQEEETP